MQFEIVILFSVAMVVFIVMGLAFKNLVFGVIGAVVALFLGISLAGSGVTFVRVVNDTLVNQVAKGGFTAAFGALLILLGIYLSYCMYVGGE